MTKLTPASGSSTPYPHLLRLPPNSQPPSVSCSLRPHADSPGPPRGVSLALHPRGTSCPSPPCFSLPPAPSPRPPLASPTGMRRLQGKANSIRLMNRTWRPRAHSQVGREVGQGLLRPSCPCPATPAQKEAKGPRRGQGWALAARLLHTFARATCSQAADGGESTPQPCNTPGDQHF